MRLDDYYDEPPEDDSDDGWREGECDHCSGGDENGVTATGPLGPIYCACRIGQGADEDDCHCGPIADDQVGQPCARCS
jgi:hypothetical protein